MFGLHLIKTKLIDNKFSVVFNTLFSLRMTGDYEDRRNLDMDTEVLPLVKPANMLLIGKTHFIFNVKQLLDIMLTIVGDEANICLT